MSYLVIGELHEVSQTACLQEPAVLHTYTCKRAHVHTHNTVNSQ